MAVSLVTFAWLGQKLRPAIIHRIGTLVMCAITYRLSLKLVGHEISLALAFALVDVVAGTFNGTYAYLVADLFPTNLRFSGVAFSLNLSNIAFAGITPLLITNVIKFTHNTASPGLYMATVAAISVTVGLALRGCGGNIARGRMESV
ncbi:hypothetical protein [Paraburkholderia sp. BL23I1N1]|uniref:hypothetical protein n=1 Tax=Paraburkholderia sp. BL23I1N1 TaxID=1938802 RepID=UPI000E76F814|nr:hypothetical protein [Paraburkholderia sp. BL23I1N1]